MAHFHPFHPIIYVRGITFTVPIVKATAPGLDAVLRVVAIPWNR